jgi:hypothetical protein
VAGFEEEHGRAAGLEPVADILEALIKSVISKSRK